jgi:hypothetical protein
MNIYTKYTLGTFALSEVPTPDNIKPEIQSGLDTKMAQMVAEGKTDGVPVRVSPNQVKRVWLDQAAAEEWFATVQSLKNSQGATGHTLEIFDNV